MDGVLLSGIAPGAEFTAAQSGSWISAKPDARQDIPLEKAMLDASCITARMASLCSEQVFPCGSYPVYEGPHNVKWLRRFKVGDNPSWLCRQPRAHVPAASTANWPCSVRDGVNSVITFPSGGSGFEPDSMISPALPVLRRSHPPRGVSTAADAPGRRRIAGAGSSHAHTLSLSLDWNEEAVLQSRQPMSAAMAAFARSIGKCLGRQQGLLAGLRNSVPKSNPIQSWKLTREDSLAMRSGGLSLSCWLSLPFASRHMLRLAYGLAIRASARVRPGTALRPGGKGAPPGSGHSQYCAFPTVRSVRLPARTWKAAPSSSCGSQARSPPPPEELGSTGPFATQYGFTAGLPPILYRPCAPAQVSCGSGFIAHRLSALPDGIMQEDDVMRREPSRSNCRSR